ncbi:MAG: dUTP diphosphatase [Proteobacteria bacterium]|nr:dUTP diphosphatase [Pseudomonadota bacterium]
MKIAIQRLPHASDLPLPAYATEGSAGMDLHAAVDGDIDIQQGARAVIPTGLSIELPEGVEAQVRPRSGLAANHGVTVLNTPGTVDSDYRGEIKVILINLGDKPFVVSRGMRIAQMVIAQHARVTLVESETLSETGRGGGGHGSTGLHNLATKQN